MAARLKVKKNGKIQLTTDYEGLLSLFMAIDTDLVPALYRSTAVEVDDAIGALLNDEYYRSVLDSYEAATRFAAGD